jgi:hypothetical protein
MIDSSNHQERFPNNLILDAKILVFHILQFFSAFPAIEQKSFMTHFGAAPAPKKKNYGVSAPARTPIHLLIERKIPKLKYTLLCGSGTQIESELFSNEINLKISVVND